MQMQQFEAIDKERYDIFLDVWHFFETFGIENNKDDFPSDI
jgi:hypothetical protein